MVTTAWDHGTNVLTIGSGLYIGHHPGMRCAAVCGEYRDNVPASADGDVT